MSSSQPYSSIIYHILPKKSIPKFPPRPCLPLRGRWHGVSRAGGSVLPMILRTPKTLSLRARKRVAIRNPPYENGFRPKGTSSCCALRAPRSLRSLGMTRLNSAPAGAYICRPLSDFPQHTHPSTASARRPTCRRMFLHCAHHFLQHFLLILPPDIFPHLLSAPKPNFPSVFRSVTQVT